MIGEHFPYRTLVFDCDGVILDSNWIKTVAFRNAALPYGAAAAQALVDYHVARGGISRYEKLRHFLERLVPAIAPGIQGPNLQELLVTYASEVRQGLMSCAVTPGLAELRAAMPNVRWLVVSGGDQVELREIFKARGLFELFDGGIFGSPENKDNILARETKSGNIIGPALFLGDSRYDHEAASRAGLDFVFISDWSEVDNWKRFVEAAGVPAICAVRDLRVRFMSISDPPDYDG